MWLVLDPKKLASPNSSHNCLSNCIKIIHKLEHNDILTYI